MSEQAAAIAIVVGLTEVVKRFWLDSRFAALVALVIGVGFAFLTQGLSTVQSTALDGIIYGLTASGLYSGTKALIEK